MTEESRSEQDGAKAARAQRGGAQGNAGGEAAAGQGDAHAAPVASSLAFVVDDDDKARDFISAILADLGIDAAGYPTAKDALAALDERHPRMIFLDIALQSSDAIDVIHGLKQRDYRGVVHLMSGGRPWLLESIARLGKRQGIALADPLPKPVSREAIVQAAARG